MRWKPETHHLKNRLWGVYLKKLALAHLLVIQGGREGQKGLGTVVKLLFGVQWDAYLFTDA